MCLCLFIFVPIFQSVDLHRPWIFWLEQLEHNRWSFASVTTILSFLAHCLHVWVRGRLWKAFCMAFFTAFTNALVRCKKKHFSNTLRRRMTFTSRKCILSGFDYMHVTSSHHGTWLKVRTSGFHWITCTLTFFALNMILGGSSAKIWLGSQPWSCACNKSVGDEPFEHPFWG